jgi:hypothetical protein
MYSTASRSVTNGFRPGTVIGLPKPLSQVTGSGEPQCQLAVRTEMAVDECRYRRGQGITGKIETAHNFPRDIFRGILDPMLGGVKCDDANRVAVLAGHRLMVVSRSASPEIGFRKGRAKIILNESTRHKKEPLAQPAALR